MIEINRQGEVWVFAEQEDGVLSDVPLELLGRGRELADKLSVKLAAVLPGKGVAGLSADLGAYGADKVYVVDDDLLEHYQSVSYTKVLCELIQKHKPQIVLYGATAIGRDLAPRVASKMRAGLTADCTDLQIGDYEVKRLDQVHKDLLLQVRPAFGGNIIATIVNPDRWPQMATVREGVMAMPSRNGKVAGEVVRESVKISPEDLAVKILDRHRAAKKVDLKASRVIVAGGAGVGSKDNFQLIWDLANVLGGAPGGSRAAVDLGFIDHDHQVGQTGTTVRPALYVAVGISGAIQHVAGMSGAAKIVAINNDPDAPIFSVAHYKIVGDLNDVLPRLTKAIRTKC
ncbi:MAG: electron transfer flavoprotein subunit alpha/FixB family protein [Sedimentisphaerales bacterium]|nr:electron transfer flavoprotein subunit alpha/FixB family protein [Sedimentisphaerales bacterium]